MTQSIGRSYTFCAAHRIMGHEGKCKNLHGHTYTAEIVLKLKSVGADAKLDDLGRILDYSVMDEVFGAWISRNWDHGAILSSKDPLAFFLEEGKSKLYRVELQPTAEVLALDLQAACIKLMDVFDIRFSHVELSRVIIRESPTSFAEVS